jgi:dTDP-4-amino-4,6-dideoxygalactose transaminase
MITTNSDDLAARISLLRSHGGVRRQGRFSFEDAGFNYRLSEIHGAMGIEQMKKVDHILATRRKLALALSEALDGIAGTAPPAQPDYAGHSYQSFVILLAGGIDRDRVIAQMYQKGIETTIGTYALHLEPYFARTYNYAAGDLPVSKEAFQRSLTLPLYVGLAEKEIAFITKTLKNILKDNQPGGATAALRL